MAFTYNIKTNSDDSDQRSPYWIAMFIRLDNPAFFDRNKDKNLNNAVSRSFNVIDNNSIAEKKPIIITHDCISFNTTSSKANHVSGISLTFANGGIDFVKEVSCGDWLLFWIFDNVSDYNRVHTILQSKGENGNIQANGFNDGLKFVGRVTSVSRKASRDTKVGFRHVYYNISGKGFYDLDMEIYYNNSLATQWQDLNSFLQNVLGIAIDKWIAKNALVDTQTVIPFLFNTLLGLGTIDNTTKTFTSGGQKFVASPNSIYKIPNTLHRILLGKDSDFPKNKGAGFTFSDILRIIIGVQKYTYSNNDINEATSSTNFTDNKIAPSIGFNPDNWIQTDKNIFITGTPLSGKFIPTQISFNNTSVWRVAEQFINHPIDEIYTCLRIGNDTNILPTIVCRQVPFNTDFMFNSGSGATFTSFFDLPRWKIDQSLVIDEEFIKDESLRKNYIHAYGYDPEGTNSSENTANLQTKVAPFYSKGDIERHGLKALNLQLPIKTVVLDNDPMYWTELLADQMMDSQEKLTGTITCKGIQVPICEGDNLEYQDNLYHIERVMHIGNVDAQTGKKVFNTILQVSNGLALNQISSNSVDYPKLQKFAQTVEPEPKGFE